MVVSASSTNRIDADVQRLHRAVSAAAQADITWEFGQSRGAGSVTKPPTVAMGNVSSH